MTTLKPNERRLSDSKTAEIDQHGEVWIYDEAENTSIAIFAGDELRTLIKVLQEADELMEKK